jgi:hypothetical protein
MLLTHERSPGQLAARAAGWGWELAGLEVAAVEREEEEANARPKPKGTARLTASAKVKEEAKELVRVNLEEWENRKVLA